jgi:hypothetical protein
MNRVMYKVIQSELDLYGSLWPSKISEIFMILAEEIERRGSRGDDLDPVETADWLREQAFFARENS